LPDLTFTVTGVEPAPHSATPLLHFKLLVENLDRSEPIPAVMLRCQIRIDPARRPYVPSEQEKLSDLFGEPERWGQTLHSMLWTHSNVVIPPFQGSIAIDLPVACTFDLMVAGAKYFNGLEQGVAPLSLLFSGTIFHQNSEGALQIAQIPWTKEAQFCLPAETWRQLMDTHYPNQAWVCLRRDVFERLNRYKRARGIPTWEQALESVLP
jgi:hypothetical protein